MHRPALIMVFVILSLTSLQAQSNQADSLKLLLGTTQSDSAKVEINRQLSSLYVWSWPDSTVKFATEASNMASRLNLKEQQINLLCLLGFAYSAMGNFSIGLEKTFEASEIAAGFNDPQLIAFCNSVVGTIYFDAGDYNSALSYFLRSKDVNAYLKNRSGYLNPGLLGETYFHLNQFDSALFYTRQSYEMLKKFNEHWSVPYLYMGKLYEHEGQLSKALEFYKASLSESTAKADHIKGYQAVANIFKKTAQIDSSIYYARLAYSLSRSTSIYIYSYEVCDQLKQLYKGKNLDSAFKYQELMLTVKDNLYSLEKFNEMQNVTSREKERQQEIENEKAESRNRIRINAFLGSTFTLFVIAFFLYRNNRIKQKAKQKIEEAYDQLKSTQSQLIQSEKMASLGELTAGIAHEIQNPLNFVNNFSEVNTELIDELKKELAVGNRQSAEALADDIRENESKINHHGKRADAIVKGMLQHSRSSSSQKELTDINALCDEYLRLSYHGLRAKDKSFNAKFETDFDASLPKVNVVSQDIGRVILNLINNAFYAVAEKRTQQPGSFEPSVVVRTRKLDNKVEIRVADNGNGIPQRALDKIFQPFFTTKPAGQGTGLGLSLSYDIVKAHGGELKVETREGEGSEFIIELPIV